MGGKKSTSLFVMRSSEGHGWNIMEMRVGVQVGLKSPSRDLWDAIFTPAVSRPASNQRICCYDTRECSFPQSGPLSNNRVIFLRSRRRIRSRLISLLNNKRVTLR